MENVARGACLSTVLGALLAGCGTTAHSAAPVTPHETPEVEAPVPELSEATVIPLATLRADTASFGWFDFKPGVRKLILSGTPDSRHVSVLWYGYEGKPGAVATHYHEKTEAIFVIDGAQSDGKGSYAKGSFYFNPPGSGHDISNSAGLFLLSYAAPPDFKRAADITPYENLTIGADYGQLGFSPCAGGGTCHPLPLAANGGMTSRFVKPGAATVSLSANVLVVLQGACIVTGHTMPADTLVVTKSTEPAPYQVRAASDDCLLFELSFS